MGKRKKLWCEDPLFVRKAKTVNAENFRIFLNILGQFLLVSKRPETQASDTAARETDDEKPCD